MGVTVIEEPEPTTKGKETPLIVIPVTDDKLAPETVKLWLLQTEFEDVELYVGATPLK